MKRINIFVPAYPILVGCLLFACPANLLAQKTGGTLRAQLRGNPPSLSIHEEATISTNFPALPMFNNLVTYNPKASLETPKQIIPELAKKWQWSKDGLSLTFVLRENVRWHDHKPLTSHDIKYTWDILKGASTKKLRKNPRKIWYQQVKHISTKGDWQVTFHLHVPQPSLLAMLASGLRPCLPCSYIT